MRRVFLAIAIASAAILAAEPSSAQVRLQIYSGQPRVQMRRLPPVLIPRRVIPPSVALQRAMMAAPQAKAIGVRMNKPRNLYVVKLKQGNRVMQLRVDAATGDLLP